MAALAFPSTVPLFLLFLIIICFLSHQFHPTIAKPTTGFSLKLIHRDSQDSPVYPGNLSPLDQIRRLVDISESRFLQLQSMATKTIPIDHHPDLIRPRVGNRGYLYLVQLGIGTPSKIYYLVLDTASDLIWTQCEPCESCFTQRQPIFNPQFSSSFKTLPCDHPFCNNLDCVGGKCVYYFKYASGQTTKGVLSNESFAFLSNTGATESKNDIVFGCSNNNQNFTDFDGDGILGMSFSVISLTGQIKNEMKRRFSYCLVQSGLRVNSFLRMGDDVVIKAPRSSLQTTPFVSYKNPTMYALNLLDISVENNRIGFPPGTFASKPDGTGGCVIDSGSAITFMDTQPYETLKAAIIQNLEQYHLQKIEGARYHLDLCYQLPMGFNRFPSITFHFQNADLKVLPANLFVISNRNQIFCLGMKPKNGSTLFGAMQQQNIRFVYDIGTQGRLSFVPEDCSQDGQ
ncbi:Peptidase A1 [Macleaya cordata]|uniref:Peptidase A1 n=1 Tax=Macleaya cordata TaxID=56857 RepID=A0A200QKW8_MACCD|nr:Peptidase A1 [Macleaya cordata]